MTGFLDAIGYDTVDAGPVGFGGRRPAPANTGSATVNRVGRVLHAVLAD